MRRRSVLILFRHQLFGEAIARAMAANDQLKVTSCALSALSRHALDALAPNAIVIEGPLNGDGEAALIGAPPKLTIVVGPETNVAEVYERREVIHASASEISARIMAATGPKRVTIATRRSAAVEQER